MSLLAGMKVTQVNFSGKMQDNLDSTENTSLYLGKLDGDLVMTCVYFARLPILKIPDEFVVRENIITFNLKKIQKYKI